MFKNFKMTTLVVLVLVAMLGLMVVLGYNGASELKQANESGTVLYKQNVLPMATMGEFSRYFYRTWSNTMQAALTTHEGKRAPLLNKVDQRLKTTDEHVVELEGLIKNDEVREAFADVKTSWRTMRNDLRAAIKILQAGETGKVLASMVDGPMDEHRQTLGEAIEKVTKLVGERSKQRAEYNTMEAEGAIQSTIILLVVALAMVALFSVLLYRRMTTLFGQLTGETEKLATAAVEGQLATRADASDAYLECRPVMEGFNRILDAVINPLNVAANYVDRISKGDIPERISDTYNGDFNSIKNNLNMCVDNLNNLIEDMKHMSDEHDKGDIDVAIEVDKFQGAYRVMGAGVNTMVFGHIAVKKKAMACIAEFGRGNFEAPLERFPGKKAFINETIEQVRVNLKALMADAAMLSKAAVEGKLTTRADANQHQGDFRRIIEGVNLTLDTIVGFIDSMPAPAMFIDKDFNIQYMNKTGASLGKTDSRKLVGSKCFDFFKTGDCHTDRCACAKAMKSGQLASSQTVAKPAETYDIDYSGVPIRNQTGQIIGAMEVVTDQTAVRKAALLAKKIGDFQQNEVKKAAGCLTRLARGDLEFEATVESADSDTQGVADTFAVIADAVNRCKSAVGSMAQDANMLSKAATAGLLSTRAEAERHQGEFRRIIQGVNDTLDAVIGPLNVAARYVNDISKGAIPPKIVDSYNGDFNAIKDNLNQCVDAVNNLVADALMLAEAAVEGKLTTRADAGRHQGDFKKIVQGVNNTLDAVLAPIDEAAGVLEKLSQRDLRARVQGNYQGDHAKIKDSINATGEALHDALLRVAVAVDQVSSASGQIASSSQSVADGASEQASALEETASSLESMSSMTKRSAENAIQANGLSQTARVAATEGVGAMEQMGQAMTKIRAAAEGTSQIIKDINEIAFQTNLLALNAAVEAARAGEAGRGFAVVAEEVRSLALRSKEAAMKTEELIKESVRQAGEGEIRSKGVSTKLGEIVTGISKVTEIVAEISAAAKEQSGGIDQVNRAVTEMNKVTQQNAANSEESSSAASELSSQSEELAAMIGGFHLLRQTMAHSARRPEKQEKNKAHGPSIAKQRQTEDIFPLEEEASSFKDF